MLVHSSVSPQQRKLARMEETNSGTHPDSYDIQMTPMDVITSKYLRPQRTETVSVTAILSLALLVRLPVTVGPLESANIPMSIINDRNRRGNE